MLDNITDILMLREQAKDIQDFLETTVSEQVEEVLERGNQLSAVVARTGKMLADALYHRDTLLKSEIVKAIEKQAKEHLPALVVKQMIETACRDYNHTYTWCERLNKSATHQLDWCRTIVSNAKSEREAGKNFNTQK